MRTYSNPLCIHIDHSSEIENNNKHSVCHPDPYVLKWNGQYYAYATAKDGVSIIHSKDLVNWTSIGYAYQEEGRSDYWAPAVIYDNGTFYLYVSNMPSGHHDPHLQVMRVATSSSPLGPFLYRKTLFETFSIDAHVVRDDNDELVLFYSTNETFGIDDNRAGTVILADRMIDPLTPEGNPKLIVRPTLDEEVFAENRFGDGRNWHTIEGAFHHKRGRKHYVMYSGNAFTSPYYYIGYSIAEVKDGQSLTQLSWQKYPDDDTYKPLLRQNIHVEGVGHNSVAKAPNNIDDWIVYHGRDVLVNKTDCNENEERRQMRIDPIHWHGDLMYISGPTYLTQPAPAVPLFRDLFDHPDGVIGQGWTTEGGDWEIHDGQLLQKTQVGVGRASINALLPYALLEANIRWEPSHMGGLYGVALLSVDDNCFVEVLFDVGKRTIGIYETIRNIKMKEIILNLKTTFRFDVYHQLIVSCAERTVRVELDGMEMLFANVNTPLSRYALVTYYTSARFAGITLTGALSFSRLGAEACVQLMSPVAGEWRFIEDCLVGMPKHGDAALAIHNPFMEFYSVCRFKIKGTQWRVDLEFVLERGVTRTIAITDQLVERKETLRIQYEESLLQVWSDNVLVFSELLLEYKWRSISINSNRKLVVQYLEWVELGNSH
ncbi:glycoside hydrolase family 43 protein [Paenibacillus sp. PL2-23]|uniref:glycoside hydrolase family 43 protein n=1 Tax=Paenibacillus sp. PL2-23 TaxID=2100729 RepID=UPI0030F633BA